MLFSSKSSSVIDNLLENCEFLEHSTKFFGLQEKFIEFGEKEVF